MPRIAFELDLPETLAKAAAEKGLLSSQAMTELIKREVAQSNATPHTSPSVRRQPWMEGIVPPHLLGQGKILVDDDQFIAPIDTEWESAGEAG
jgi:hypothetical protein